MMTHDLLRTVALAMMVAVGVAPPPSAFSVELIRGGSNEGRERRWGRLSSSVIQGKQRNRPRNGNRALTAGMVGVADCENLEYTGFLGLGTPAQEFRVLFSISSSALWVASSKCESCASSSGGYDSSLSTTYVPEGSEVSITTTDGYVEAEGVLSIDLLTIGGLSSAVVFGEMTEANLDGCTALDGVIGMGLTNEEETNAFEDFVEAGVVDVPVFAFFMGNIDSGSPDGVLTVGGVNQTHYEGCLEWMPVSESVEGTYELPGSVPEGYWSFGLKDIKLGSESVLRSEATAILDTGSPFVVGPLEDVVALADKIGAMCVRIDEDESAEIINCLDDPFSVALIVHFCNAEFDDINFYFGGEDYALTPTELLQPLTDFEPPNPATSSDPLCLFGITGEEATDTWVLGDPFLRTFYTAYNVEERTVGIAKATGSRTGEGCAADADLSSGSSGSAAATAAPSTSSDAGSSSIDESGDEDTAAVAASGEEEESDGETEANVEQTSLIAVAMSAALATMALLACGAFVVAVRQRWRDKAWWRGEGGVGRGRSDFEMSSARGRKDFASMAAARHGGEVCGDDGDFLQASPRNSDGGSSGAVKASKAVFGRLLGGGGPSRAGFAAVENSEDEDGGVN